LKKVFESSNNFIFLLLEFNKNSSLIESNFNIFFKGKEEKTYAFYRINFIYKFGNIIKNLKENNFLEKNIKANPNLSIKNFNLFKKNKNLRNFNFLFSKIEVLFFLFFKPTLLKFFFSYTNIFNKNNFFQSIINLFNSNRDKMFKSNRNQVYLNNLLPNVNFIYLLKKKIIKIFNYLKFNITPTP
jgi:hypothetical protein